MGYSFAISNEKSLFFKEPIFEAIFKSTQQQFTDDEYACMKKIYETYDDQCLTFIGVDIVDEKCFNIFFWHCFHAMYEYIDGDYIKKLGRNTIPRVYAQWMNVIEELQKDPRFQAPEI